MSTTSIPPETPTETTHPFTDAERAELGDRLAAATVLEQFGTTAARAAQDLRDGLVAAVPVVAANLGTLARRLRANAECEQCAQGHCAFHGKIR